MLPDFQWSHLHRSKEQIQTRNIDTRITLQISSNIKTYHVYISSYQVIECDSVKLNRTNENIERAVREKTSSLNEFRILLPDGTVNHVESICLPVFSASGDFVEIIGTGIDVTERKRAEDALREREAQLAEARRELRQLIDTIRTPVASYSA